MPLPTSFPFSPSLSRSLRLDSLPAPSFRVLGSLYYPVRFNVHSRNGRRFQQRNTYLASSSYTAPTYGQRLLGLRTIPLSTSAPFFPPSPATSYSHLIRRVDKLARRHSPLFSGCMLRLPEQLKVAPLSASFFFRRWENSVIFQFHLLPLNIQYVAYALN